MSGERYKAIEGSYLGHGCCFGATVIDTTKDEPNAFCECFTMDDARLIADALNSFGITRVLPEKTKPL